MSDHDNNAAAAASDEDPKDGGGDANGMGRDGHAVRHHHRRFPSRRAQYVLETESTEAQCATEEECAPFFVELDALSERQLDHLRGIGLIPPLPGGRRAGRRGKAARLLGEEDEDLGPLIEMLDGETTSPVEDDGGGVPLDPYAIRLLREKHASYLTNALCDPLPRGFVSLDASHPWMVYWCLHSIDLLGYFDDSVGSVNERTGLGGGLDPLREVELLRKGHLLRRIVSTLHHCWTDVALKFGADEVASNGRLRRLHEEQKGRIDVNSVLPSFKGGEIKLHKERNGSINANGAPLQSPQGARKITLSGGGFGGGPGQMPHCAPTYAAVLSLCIVAGVGLEKPKGHPFHEAGKLAMEMLVRRRLQLYAYFLTLRESDGGKGDEERTVFRMQHDGEVDVRASYCILAPCYLLGLLDSINSGSNGGNEPGDGNPLQSPSISRHIASCQTFEGGFGAEPHNEAHGGYTFCALAALRILGAVSAIDAGALRSWLARRQMSYEGGFCGRTNKLVDGCYSFWQGGATSVLDGWFREEEGGEGGGRCGWAGSGSRVSEAELSLDEAMLQRYILLCAQDVNGGLRDKPSKPKDFYHSCYNLSGLSAAQRAPRPWPPSLGGVGDQGREEKEELNDVFGDVGVNVVARTDPVINIRAERVRFVLLQSFRE